MSACDLVLKPAAGVTIAVVSSGERKWRQPGLAADDPAFIGRHQLVRGVQGSQVHFDFVGAACENGRAAAGTEKPPGVVAGFAIDRHRILRKYRRRVKKGPMMLATVETVTKADPVWESGRHDSNLAAQATAGESVHASRLLYTQAVGAFTTNSTVIAIARRAGGSLGDFVELSRGLPRSGALLLWRRKHCPVCNPILTTVDSAERVDCTLYLLARRVMEHVTEPGQNMEIAIPEFARKPR